MIRPFYLIVDRAHWIAPMADVGVRFIQLRVKDLAGAALAAEIAAARDAATAAGATLVVNDYWREAIDLGCDFVHLGQEDLDAADLAAIRAAGLRLGVSTHDHAELDRALSVRPDYVALGPVYETTLKKMRWAPQGVARVGEWKRAVGATPLVAIGGLTLERAPAVFDAGADSISVVSDVLKAEDPRARAAAWCALVAERQGRAP